MKKLSLTVLLMVISILGIPMPSSLMSELDQREAKVRVDLPTGEWSLTCGPAEVPGPIVDVYSVLTEAKKGLTITQAGLKNRYTKTVTAVRLGWRLYYTNSPEDTLIDGQTPFLHLVLQPGERRKVEFPVVTFTNICKSLLKNGKLQGDFRIEVTAIDFRFEDSVSKKGLESNNVTYTVKLKLVAWGVPEPGFVEVTSWRDPIATEEGCQNQECYYNVAGQCYQCKDKANFGCQVINCDQCNETR